MTGIKGKPEIGSRSINEAFRNLRGKGPIRGAASRSLTETTRSSQPGTIENYIAQRIRQNPHAKTPFPEFMEMALYLPKSECAEAGYYQQAVETKKTFTDFRTDAMNFSPYFGYAVAQKVFQFWLAMGAPRNFSLVTMGEGNGVLTRDILDALAYNFPPLYKSTKITIIEISPRLIETQKQNLRNHPQVKWLNQSALSGSLPEIEGIFISNELPDAFPVHLVSKNKRGALGEEWVKARIILPRVEEFEGIWKAGVSPEIANVLTLAKKPLPVGLKVPVNLNALHWIKSVTHALKRGFHIVFDYGFSGPAYPKRSAGLIWTMFRGMCGVSPYWEPGKRDITSLVDFDILKEVGEREGAKTVLLGLEEEFFRGLFWSPPPQPGQQQEEAAKEFYAYQPGKMGLLALVQAKGV